MQRTFLAPLLIVVALVSLSTGCCSESPEAKKEREAARSTYLDQLRAAHAAVAKPGPPAPARCPELQQPDPKKSYGGWDGFGKAITLEALGQLAPGAKPGDPPPGAWAWLSNDWILETIDEELGRPKKDLMAQSHVYMLSMSPYLIVFDGTRRRMPEIKGEGFDSGLFEGRMVVVELKTGKPLCQAPLEVTSSETVSHRTRGLLAKDADQAVADDFKDAFRKAAAAALATAAPTLKVSIH